MKGLKDSLEILDKLPMLTRNLCVFQFHLKKRYGNISISKKSFKAKPVRT